MKQKSGDTPPPAATDPVSSSKEWQLITRVVDGIHKEQRVARRWSIFFKSAMFIYLFFCLVWFVIQTRPMSYMKQDHVAIIDVYGLIAARQEAGSDNLVSALKQAFESEHVQAIVLQINSPGGSPVQAGYVYDEIQRHKALKPDKVVYAVISDTGTSGAYYIAAAANYIYADKASIIGSIGVISQQFGFDGLMKQWGIEQRSYTAGQHKAFLDPFQSENPFERAHLQAQLDNIHQQFITQVKHGRGQRLADDKTLFSGLVWTGEEALKLGLVDGLGSVYSVMRDQIGQEEWVRYNPKKNLWQQLKSDIGGGVSAAITETLSLPSNNWAL